MLPGYCYLYPWVIDLCGFILKQKFTLSLPLLIGKNYILLKGAVSDFAKSPSFIYLFAKWLVLLFS